MRNNKRIKYFFIATLACLGIAGAIIRSSHAQDRSGIFDELFANNEYTVYTDKTISNIDQLTSLINAALPFRIPEYNEQSSESDSYLETYPQNCNFDALTCDFTIERYTLPDFTREAIKTYEDVQIIIDPNTSQFFPMLEGNTLKINYDDSLFSSDDEKLNYINSYISSYNKWNSDTQTNTIYQYNPAYGRIYYTLEKDNVCIQYVEKELDEIVFNFDEGPYSDDFKKLTTDGTLTVKTDLELSKNIVQEYVRSYGNFSVEGNVKDNRALIKLTQWDGDTKIEEEHIVNLIQDSNIDLGIFSRVNLASNITIPADTPENIDYDNNISRYVSNYLNLNTFAIINEDNNLYEEYRSSCSYDGDYTNFDSENCYTQYIKRARYDFSNIYDIQLHKTPVAFAGYTENTSENFSNYIGSEIIVNADSINSIYDIQDYLSYTKGFSKQILSCNQDKTICDIALQNNETYETEIHPVTIRLDNTISEEFKDAFGLDDNNTLEIIVDEGISTSNLWLYFSDTAGISYEINGNQLTLRNYSKGKKESHNVNFNTVVGGKSSEFSSLVNADIEVYPGETANIWDSNIRNEKELFMKQYSSKININSCNSNTRACTVALFNSDKKIEIHNSNVIIKDGKSPQYTEAFPSDNITINAVNIGDADFVNDAARAYFLGKTKTNAYLRNYLNEEAKLYFDSIESHTVHIEFAENNEEIKAIVDEAAARLDSENLNFTQSDLEYLNGFYYGSSNVLQRWNTMNFNSQSVQEKINGVINNEHINYFLSTYGGGGTYYSEGNGGRIVLYYDGIAYSETEKPFVVQRTHIIYVPDETPDTVDDYIKAAQKRVDGYFGENSGILISYGNEVADDFDPSWYDIDPDNFDGNDYIISRDGATERILIIKDSSKIQKATFVATDVYNNVTVEADEVNYPTNTVVSSEKEEEGSSIYNQLLEKLGLDYAQIIDINLYSASIGLIKNFGGETFNVSLPIDWNKFSSKNLFAYYISDDGKIEEHPIESNGFFGRFKTKHFSTYIISEKVDDEIIENANNPETHTGSMRQVTLFVISIIGTATIAATHYTASKRQKEVIKHR